MGFLRRLFGGKKHRNPPPEPAPKPNKDKRSWSFTKNSTRNKSNSLSPHNNYSCDLSTSFTDNLDPNKHAIAVAAATAAVAEAALAAAHAAAEVVRLTSSGGGAGSSSARQASPAKLRRRSAEEYDAAAVKIQSAFRGYLARRALRALKALVKLQALVRGNIVRKQTADMLRRMQTLVRLQSRARATRVHTSNNMHSFKSSFSHYPVHDDYEQPLRVNGTKSDGSSILKRCSSNANICDIDLGRARFGSDWLDYWMEENSWSKTRDALKNVHLDDERSDKILEVDTWKPHLNSNQSSSSFQTPHHYLPSHYKHENFMAYESSSKRSSKLQKAKEDVAALRASQTLENSPQSFSASSSRLGNGGNRGPFTPTKSESSLGFFSGYPGYPNYMANTESSRAKARSQSAPRQRMEFERYGSTRRSIQGSWEEGSLDRDSDFRSSKAYSTTSSLNRVGSTNLR